MTCSAPSGTRIWCFCRHSLLRIGTLLSTPRGPWCHQGRVCMRNVLKSRWNLNNSLLHYHRNTILIDARALERMTFSPPLLRTPCCTRSVAIIYRSIYRAVIQWPNLSAGCHIPLGSWYFLPTRLLHTHSISTAKAASLVRYPSPVFSCYYIRTHKQ